MKEHKMNFLALMVISIAIAAFIGGWYFFKTRVTIREYTWKSPEMYYFGSLEKHTPEEARQMTLKWLRKNPAIQDTGLSNDGTILWIKYEDGEEVFIEIGPPEKKIWKRLDR